MMEKDNFTNKIILLKKSYTNIIYILIVLLLFILVFGNDVEAIAKKIQYEVKSKTQQTHLSKIIFFYCLQTAP